MLDFCMSYTCDIYFHCQVIVTSYSVSKDSCLIGKLHDVLRSYGVVSCFFLFELNYSRGYGLRQVKNIRSSRTVLKPKNLFLFSSTWSSVAARATSERQLSMLIFAWLSLHSFENSKMVEITL